MSTNEYTAKYIKAIGYRNENNALDFIRNHAINDVNPMVDMFGNTALHLACKKGMHRLATAILHSNKRENIGLQNDDGDTALMIACKSKMNETAFDLIQSGESNPGAINKYGNTALIIACNNRMTKVALALLQTGQSEPDTVNQYGKSALMIAREKNMYIVVEKLEHETGIKAILPTTITNLYRGVNLDLSSKVYILLNQQPAVEKNKKDILVLLQDPSNIVYDCGSSTAANRSTEYFLLSAIGLFGVVELKSFESMLLDHQEKYQLIETNLSLNRIQQKGTSGCQPRQNMSVFKLIASVDKKGGAKRGTRKGGKAANRKIRKTSSTTRKNVKCLPVKL